MKVQPVPIALRDALFDLCPSDRRDSERAGGEQGGKGSRADRQTPAR
jgi:hypothetical protein